MFNKKTLGKLFVLIIGALYQKIFYNQTMLFIFDMGGVVTTSFNLNTVLDKLNISRDIFFNICKLDDDIWKLLETGKITSLLFWEIFNKRIGSLQRSMIDGTNTITFNIEEINKIKLFEYDLFRLNFHPILNEKTVEIIHKLKKKHRVVCGTNTIQSHWENHLERGDYEFFDQTYASNKIGYAKPDKRFFELILEAENINAKDTFFTDDKLENCNAASSVGINAIHFTNTKELLKVWKNYF